MKSTRTMSFGKHFNGFVTGKKKILHHVACHTSCKGKRRGGFAVCLVMMLIMIIVIIIMIMMNIIIIISKSQL